MSAFNCPACNARIRDKHYDEIWKWYECPGCEGCFTFDELLEGGGKALSNGSGATETVRRELAKTKTGLVAKGKVRRSEIQEDEEADQEHIKKMLKPKVKQQEATHHRDEVPTKQVVNIFADEIQTLYEETGHKIDFTNARDKALVIWREIHTHSRVTAREHEFDLTLCGEH